jgi:hypothetical protein
MTYSFKSHPDRPNFAMRKELILNDVRKEFFIMHRWGVLQIIMWLDRLRAGGKNSGGV